MSGGNKSLTFTKFVINPLKAYSDTLNMATVLNENGVVYEYQKKYDKAIQCYSRSLELTRIINDTLGMA
ncbi:MAG TPA: tetratricopeptide repeat protein, partial [Flavobacterium sp.]|nr:tetratricopeptide repeat protein [Flavobacterium sp.]